MNTIVLVANLTRNPELRHTTAHATVSHLTIASDRSRKADAKTDFFSCEAWALLAEQVNENFAKGDFVRVTGYVKLDASGRLVPGGADFTRDRIVDEGRDGFPLPLSRLHGMSIRRHSSRLVAHTML